MILVKMKLTLYLAGTVVASFDCKVEKRGEKPGEFSFSVRRYIDNWSGERSGEPNHAGNTGGASA